MEGKRWQKEVIELFFADCPCKQCRHGLVCLEHGRLPCPDGCGDYDEGPYELTKFSDE